MKISSFEWDEINIEHISKHGITPEEVEESCSNNPLILRGRWNRYYILGQSDTGRYIVAILQYKFRGIVRVITAREMTDAERRRYLRR